MPVESNKFYLDPVKRYGKGYSRILNCKKRYLVIKGGIASKKSWNIAERWIELLTQFPQSNLLVVRRWAVLNGSSTYSELSKAIKRMHLDSLWKAVKSPLEIRNRQTNQKILFRGCDDPDSLASITTEVGYLNFVWIEEAFQLERQEMFDRIDDRVRGKLPFGYFAQIVMTFNPWNENHWLNQKFFTLHDADILDESQTKYIKGQQIETQNRLAITTNYRLNEFLDEADLLRFEEMRINQPQRYKVAGLGHWGVIGSTIYTNWKVEDFDWRDLFFRLTAGGKPIYDHRVGLDFGFSASFAVVGLLVDEEHKEIYVYDEIYASRVTDDERYALLVAHGWNKEPVHCDSNVPEELDVLRKKGCPRFFGVKKGPGSVTSGIQKLRGYKIIVHPKCENFIIEISHYQFKQDQFGKELPEPKKEWDHCLSGNTLVQTYDGAFPIVQLVGKQGLVASSDSHGRRVWKKFRKVRMTQPSAQLYKVTLSDGRFVETTGNHLFRVKYGRTFVWHRMDELTPGMILLDVEIEEERERYIKQDRYVEKVFPGILTMGKDGLTRVVKKTQRVQGNKHNSIELDGLTFYKMRNGYYMSKVGGHDGKIIHLHSYIWEKETGQKIPEGYIVHHIDGNKENNLIENLCLVTTKEHRALHPHTNKWYKSIKQASRKRVGINYEVKNTEARTLYPDIKVVKVEKSVVEPVYNMEVDGTHCFAVNGGIIIHNCMDAMRYAMSDDEVGTSALVLPQSVALNEKQRLERYIAKRQGRTWK